MQKFDVAEEAKVQKTKVWVDVFSGNEMIGDEHTN